jgi:5-methylcytosine-specific restriction protein B
MDEIRFTLRGKTYTLSRKEVQSAMKGEEPETGRVHFVRINGRDYPVKQVLDAALKVDRLDFTAADARSILKRLGFEVFRR